MLEHHLIMRDVIREMDETSEPYIREGSYIARLHQYMAELSIEKKKQIKTAFSVDNLIQAHIIVDRDEFSGQSCLIFDRSVLGVFRLFDRTLFKELTDVSLKTQLSTIRELHKRLRSETLLFSDNDLDYKELNDELFHRLSELLNALKLNLIKMEAINAELTEASEEAAKSESVADFTSLKQASIEKISTLLTRHILPTRQFLDEKNRLKDGANLFENLQQIRRLFEINHDYQRANTILKYEVTFNTFHKSISKVSRSVDQFLARSKKRLNQFNAIENAFSELSKALDETKQNLRRTQIDGEFARRNGAFMGLMQQQRPKVLRISSSQAYMNNVVAEIEARLQDLELMSGQSLPILSSSKDDLMTHRLERAEKIYELLSSMKIVPYQDLTFALHQRLVEHLEGYHFIDLLEALSFFMRNEHVLDNHIIRVTNIQKKLINQQTYYCYRKIRTERIIHE